MAALRIADEAPNFSADTQTGPIDFHTYIEGSWVVFFSHPRDFTPVCTTEIGELARRHEEFAALGVKLVGLSCDSAEDHAAWIKDVEAHGGAPVPFPMVADADRKIAVTYNMLSQESKDAAGLPVTVRSLYIIGPDKKIKLILTYPPSCGRNYDEVLRCIQALQRAKYNIATPSGWKPGDDVMIVPSVSAEDAAANFPGHRVCSVPSGKSYLRMTADPALAHK